MSPARLTAALAALCLTAAPAPAAEVVVFAASSLKTALDLVAADFEAATGDTVTVSYAGSNQLAKQIIAGAPADIYISAATNWMDEVEKAGLVQAGTRKTLLGNTLVLVAHGTGAARVEISPELPLAAMLGEGKLSMGMVDSVPAGQYGKEALSSLGLWPSVEGSVAQSENVRAALALVSTGEAPYGIVYGSDAVADDGVTVIGTFPESSHSPISYPAALMTNAGDAADAAFFAALSSDAARGRFTAQGFTAPQ